MVYKISIETLTLNQKPKSYELSEVLKTHQTFSIIFLLFHREIFEIYFPKTIMTE